MVFNRHEEILVMKKYLFLILFPAVVFAGEGSIKGTVKAPSGPAKNVAVEVINTKKEVIKQGKTDDAGNYLIEGIKSGLYIVRCNTRESKDLVNVLTGKTAEANLSVPFAEVVNLILTAEETEEETKSDYTMITLNGDGKSGTVVAPYQKYSIHAPQGAACGEENELMIRWDLSKIPDNAVIISASMEFAMDYHIAGDCRITWCKIKKKWGVMANWETPDGKAKWSTPGAKGSGDIDPKPEGEYTVKPDAKEPRIAFNMTNLVKSWVKNKDQNFGARSVSAGAASVCVFVDVPKLIITYGK